MREVYVPSRLRQREEADNIMKLALDFGGILPELAIPWYEVHIGSVKPSIKHTLREPVEDCM